MLDASGNHFPAQQNTRGQKDRNFHSNCYTFGCTYINIYLVNL